MKKFILIFACFIIVTDSPFSLADSTALNENYHETAIFAGGCFWCMEDVFSKVKGVISVIPGYTGGTLPNPSYDQICTGTTGHYQAVKITYYESVISYQQLVDIYLRNIDPTDATGQFTDRGRQYRTAIFYSNDTQKEIAETSMNRLEDSGKFKKPFATKTLPAAPFYKAEELHQGYYKKCPVEYEQYKKKSGRQNWMDRNWDTYNYDKYEN